VAAAAAGEAASWRAAAEAGERAVIAAAEALTDWAMELQRDRDVRARDGNGSRGGYIGGGGAADELPRRAQELRASLDAHILQAAALRAACAEEEERREEAERGRMAAVAAASSERVGVVNSAAAAGAGAAGPRVGRPGGYTSGARSEQEEEEHARGYTRGRQSGEESTSRGYTRGRQSGEESTSALTLTSAAHSWGTTPEQSPHDRGHAGARARGEGGSNSRAFSVADTPERRRRPSPSSAAYTPR
jgi:hypothetical protein